MSSDAEIDAKLARVGNRVHRQNAATAEETRQELAAIGCLELAEACKARFGARLAYIKTPRVERGVNPFPRPGCVWTVYEKPKVRRK